MLKALVGIVVVLAYPLALLAAMTVLLMQSQSRSIENSSADR